MFDLDTLSETPAPAYAELKERFLELFEHPAPKQMSRTLLLRLIAHRIQENESYGPNTALKRRLRKLAKDLKVTGKVSAVPLKLPNPGTRFLREWQGETHTVSVTEGGFLHKGQTYQSLSAVAREITGTRWSGPAFFGLRDRREQTEARDGR
ncbi:MAG: DUF2924 domain-containing protein [Alphaproteobacteria bacterium]|nr:DUF2924 domain-containing protein [Alphaproteobacteria bacterium]